jgi:MEMO1 family protein
MIPYFSLVRWFGNCHRDPAWREISRTISRAGILIPARTEKKTRKIGLPVKSFKNHFKLLEKKMQNYLRYFGIVLAIYLLFLCNPSNSSSQTEDNKMTDQIRKPAVADAFYPANPVALSQMIADFFKKVKKEEMGGEIVAIISPHAGYIYSGQVAAYGYKMLEGHKFETVVIIAPNHVFPFHGASVYNGAFYETPLGKIECDQAVAKKIASYHKSVYLSDKGHALIRREHRISGMRLDSHPDTTTVGEHSLEVQLPFLQIVLGKFKLVAIIMGDQEYSTCEELGDAVSKALKDKPALIVASSDLSHFHPYDQAVKLDQVVAGRINSFDPKGLFDDVSKGKCEACGAGPIVATMLAAEELGADKGKVLKYANSGDVTKDKSSVVGYMSAVIYRSGDNPTQEEKEEKAKKVGVDMGLSQKDKEMLLNIARKTIEARVKGQKPPESKVDSEILKENRGAFVTLEKNGNLRGCIGYIQAIKPLYITIEEMAEQAALHDPRFSPVSEEELNDLHIEISVLTPLKKISDISQIEVGRDGIYIKKGFNSGLLLPQVATEYGWDRETFLEQTCYKAGLPPNAWKEKTCEIYIFSADIFGEKEIEK